MKLSVKSMRPPVTLMARQRTCGAGPGEVALALGGADAGDATGVAATSGVEDAGLVDWPDCVLSFAVVSDFDCSPFSRLMSRRLICPSGWMMRRP
jgi:hypothetical protein